MFGGGGFGGAGGFGGGGGYGGFGGSAAGGLPASGYGGTGMEPGAAGNFPGGGESMASVGYGGAGQSQAGGLGGWLGDGAAQGGMPAQQKQAQTLAPVTIRMLNDALKQAKSGGEQLPGGLDATYIVNGREVGMITLVGCVESVQQQQTFKTYTVSDGTGRLPVQHFSDSDNAVEIRPGDYVRVFGHLRFWQGQESVNAHQIAPLESANEISFHHIEVAHVHLSLAGKIVKQAPATAAPALPQASAPSFAGLPTVGAAAQGFAQQPPQQQPQPQPQQQQQQHHGFAQVANAQTSSGLFGSAQYGPYGGGGAAAGGAPPAHGTSALGMGAAAAGPYGGAPAPAGSMPASVGSMAPAAPSPYGAANPYGAPPPGSAPGNPYGDAPPPNTGMPGAGGSWGGPHSGGALFPSSSVPAGAPGSNLF